MMYLLKQLKNKFFNLEKDLQQIKFNQGLLLAQSFRNASSLNESEFKVFSQWGEDGIIQYLINKLNGSHEKFFVEFGVENFTEANCRFLLMKDAWAGAVLDSSEKNIKYILQDDISWRYPLKAQQAFITKDNIETVLAQLSTPQKLGLLSIDIDGNDYWIFEAIKNFETDILILEYNALFGADHFVTVPYESNFDRIKKHYSNLFWGASLAALTQLAEQKGYFLVGCNSNGNNAFFVHSKHQGKIPSQSVKVAYKEASFKESRGQDGKLTHLNVNESRKLIGHLEVWDIEKKLLVKIADL